MPTIALGDACTQPPHLNSAFTVTNGSPPAQPTFARGLRRNSDVPLRQHLCNLAWPTNHPEITSVYGSPRHPYRTTYEKPRNADISRPLVPTSSPFPPASGISRKRSRRSTQIIRRPRFSGSIPSGVPNKSPDEVTSQKLSLPDKQTQVSNLLGLPPDEFDSRTMMESHPALDLDLNTNAASFGSVKQRIGKIDKALRTSRTTLLLVSHEDPKPDLVYTDDSDAFPSPPSTPSTPAWEAAMASSIPKTDPKLATKLDLADVHAQIQAMIDSANRPGRPSSTGSGNFLPQGQESSNTHRNDIPHSLRPSDPARRSFPRLTTAHKRSASSPPLGSDTHHAYPPDFMDGLSYRQPPPAVRDNLAPSTSPLSKMTPVGPTFTTPADLTTPATPTKKSFSERSDSPSVYSQQSPSSGIDNVTPTSSNASSPDHPHAHNKHERLLAAISEGISSPTKPGLAAPSILGSGRRKDNKLNSARTALHTDAPAVPVIVVTDPNDDDLIYSESSFSIVDMYTGPAENAEVGQRRRTRTSDPVSCISLHALVVC